MAHRNPPRPLPVVRNQFRADTDWIGCINDMAVCPYNPNHKMKGHKLMAHLIKCEKQLKKNEPDADPKAPPAGFERCVYNTLHSYRIGQRDEHFRECKDRAAEFMSRIKSGESVEGLDEMYANLIIPAFEKERKD